MGKINFTVFVTFLFLIPLFSGGLFNYSSAENQIEADFLVDVDSKSDAFDGYLLFAPMASRKTYLINSDGDIVHTWNSDFLPGYSVYLKENGNLLHANYLGLHPYLPAHGGGIEELTPDSEIDWRFTYFNTTYMSHHDVEILPNGNILMLCQEYKDYNQVQLFGRKKNILTPNRGMAFDYIIEVKPIGDDRGIIVWEWHLWDHLIQDYDSTKYNYGVVQDHPELVDINFLDDDFYNPLSFEQLTHMNNIDYNEELDQIIISVALFSEFWVIDHSTTTFGASGHSGGRSGMGGDILYRWGNPQTYNMGTEEDQVLFEIHDAQWIEEGLPGEGNILVFNNGLSRPGGSYSSIHEIKPPVDDNGHYQLNPGEVFGPIESEWVYTAENPTDFYGNHLSGCQRIENGNTIICSGPNGKFYEVTAENEIVWSYVNRFVLPPLNHVFKACYYPPDYPGVSVLLTPDAPPRPRGKLFSLPDKNITFTTRIDEYTNNSIMFDWGDETTSDWINLDEFHEEISVSHAFDSSGLYFVKSKLKNNEGYESDWSKVFPVFVFKLSI